MLARVGKSLFTAFALCVFAQSALAIPNGRFVNPISDIAYMEVLPIKIATVPVFKGNGYDTPDPPTTPICICPAPPPLFYRLGIPISLWEPARLVETVKDPYYFASLGFGLDIAPEGQLSGTNHSTGDVGGDYSFAQSHYMIYPVWGILELLLDLACVEGSGFDVMFLSELDPLWQDDELQMLIQPEALLFANPFTQMACIADAVASNSGQPLAPLFWCVGSGGSAYPMNGHVGDDDIIQANNTIAARMIYRLARVGLLLDPGLNYCTATWTPIWYKPNYKLQPVRPRVVKKAYPIGTSAWFYQHYQNPAAGTGVGSSDNFVWMIFRKRVCCFL